MGDRFSFGKILRSNIPGKSFVKFEAHIIRKKYKKLGGVSTGDARVNKQQNPNTNC